MNVWIINHYALSPDQSGGTRHYNLARLMIDHDIESTIFASSVDYISQKDVKLNEREKRRVIDESGVRFVWLKTPKYSGNGFGRAVNMLSFSWSILFQKPDKDIPRPDVILGTSPHLFAAISAYFLSRKYKVPFIMEVRDLWPKSLVELLGMSEKHPIIRVLSFLEKFLYQRAVILIGVLQGVGEHAQNILKNPVQFLWIPNGVNLASFGGKQISYDYQPQDDFCVVYTGAHGVPNSLDTALEAASILNEQGIVGVKWLFIGEGVQKQSLIQYAKELGISNIEFRDPVPKSEIPQVLDKADALLLLFKDTPLYQDGISPNKMFDYFAAQKPVIMALDSPYNAVAQAQAGISISPENPQELANAVLEIMRTPIKERREMGRRGREYVEEHHDMRKLAEKLAKSLKEVAYINKR